MFLGNVLGNVFVFVIQSTFPGMFPELKVPTLSLQAMRDFQLAADLENRAIHLWQEALSCVVLSLGGTEARGFVTFLVDSFGGSTEYDQAKVQAMLDIPDTQNPDDTELADLDLQQDEATPRDAMAKLKDVCLLGDAKPVFPTSEVTISTTGIPKEFISENMPTGPNKQSCYYCLYGDCGASALQKASLCGHIRHKHLGVALQCKFCGQAWWTSNPFVPHMQKLHPEMDKPDWFLTLTQALQEEAEAATKAAARLPDKSTQPEVSSSEDTADPAEPPASQNPEKEPSA